MPRDAEPFIKRLKEIMEEFGGVAPNKAQFNSELALVKNLCRHWNLLEIVNCVVTSMLKDLTSQMTYACLVPSAIPIELFKRVHGHDAGHFGYTKIFPLFSERFFWHGMSTDIRDW